MKKLNFIQLLKDNEEHYHLLESLMIPYNIEIDCHHNRQTPREFIQKITRGMVNMQGASDRHLELCYDGNILIGFSASYYSRWSRATQAAWQVFPTSQSPL